MREEAKAKLLEQLEALEVRCRSGWAGLGWDGAELACTLRAGPAAPALPLLMSLPLACLPTELAV